MKIKKHVFAWGLVAGLGCVGGVGAHEQSPFDSRVEIGYFVAKAAADNFGASETVEGAIQAGFQGGGAAAGGLAAAWAGAKVGGKIGMVVGGAAGAIAGAAVGAV